MSQIEYNYGLVAFIDILGFSNLVSDVNNAKKVKDITEFVSKFQYLFNSSPKLQTKVAFFSDSIVLTTENTSRIEMLLTAIWIAEQGLYEKTGLLFRGGISKGYFYHSGSIAFGPAIVNSYNIENEANYSRIIIQDEIVKDMDNLPITIFRDTDGHYCFNPSGYGLLRNTPDSTSPTKEQIIKSFFEEREHVIKLIKDNLRTHVSDKYLWRMRAFNCVCALLPDFFDSYKIAYSDEEIKTLKNGCISFSEFLDLTIYE